MKKFKSSLDTILKLKKIAVDKEIKELSIIVGKMNKLKNEINENQRAIHNLTASYISYDVKMLRLYENYIKGLNLQNDALNLKMKSNIENLNQARLKVQEVEKDKKIIEALINKQYEVFKDRLLQSERIEEEEINNQIHRKKWEADTNETNKIIPKVLKKKIKPTQTNKNEPKTEYEKLMEYVESQKPKR